MKLFRQPAHLAVAAFGAILILGGALAARAELTPFLTARDSPTARTLELAAAPQGAGLSIAAQQLFLLDCRKAMLSVTGLTQPSAVRKRLAENCLDESDRILTQSPSFSIAWLTAAIAASVLADWERLNDRLMGSYATGPSEQWIAMLRVAVAEDNYGHLLPEAQQRHEADLRLLVASDSGIRSVAYRFLTKPDFRERIASILDEMSETDQRRFLRNVRTLAPEPSK